MAQKIDTSEFTDQFTDATVRYSQTGIDRVAMNAWTFSVGIRQKIVTIRVFQNDVLANVNAASTTPLTNNTVLRIRQAPDTAFVSTTSNAWTNVGTGLYTIDYSASSWTPGLYIIELIPEATFTNPAVSGKISVLTDASASYPAQTLTSSWIGASEFVVVNNDGQIADVDRVFDGPALALNGDLSWR